MFRRAKHENKNLLFYRYQEWIRADLKYTLDKLKIQTTTKIQVDDKHGFKIELQHQDKNVDMTMSGFESFEDLASDGVRTKNEAEIDKLHIEKLKKDLVEINSRKGSVQGRNELQSY